MKQKNYFVRQHVHNMLICYMISLVYFVIYVMRHCYVFALISEYFTSDMVYVTEFVCVIALSQNRLLRPVGAARAAGAGRSFFEEIKVTNR